MSNMQWWHRAGHGTEARARRHQREGDLPLRRVCPPCADAAKLARQLREERRHAARDELAGTRTKVTVLQPPGGVRQRRTFYGGAAGRGVGADAAA